MKLGIYEHPTFQFLTIIFFMMSSFTATAALIPTVSTKGHIIHVCGPEYSRAVPIGAETAKLFDELLAHFFSAGLLIGIDQCVANGTASALLSGVLADTMPESHRSLFEWLLQSYTGVTLSVPSKQEEARLEGRSIVNCAAGIPALRTLLEKTGNSDHIGLFNIISIGGGDSKRHVFDSNPDGFIEYIDSIPFGAKLGTKRITEDGLAELDAVLASERDVPTFLMASIGYGVSSIVRAETVSTAFAPNTDDNTRNAVALATAISTRAAAAGNTWVIPRRTYGSDILPLNMLGGLTTVIKIDAGTATWKVELPDGVVHKIPVESTAIVAEIASAFKWAYERDL
jgi:hypothetical protein